MSPKKKICSKRAKIIPKEWILLKKSKISITLGVPTVITVQQRMITVGTIKRVSLTLLFSIEVCSFLFFWGEFLRAEFWRVKFSVRE